MNAGAADLRFVNRKLRVRRADVRSKRGTPITSRLVTFGRS
jgi:hypothetical protein